MSARKFLRVELVKTDLSHLVCIACGMFDCDFGIVVDDDVGIGDEMQAGVHKKCIARVKVKRGTP